jgi:hypothetical protein
MLAMRARAFACRDAFADALRGLQVVEETAGIERAESKPAQEKPKLVLPDESPDDIASQP